MSDEYNEEFDDEQDDGPVSLNRSDLRNLRKAAKERSDLAARLAAQERELAFAKAKLDLDDPKIEYFVKGYDGDLTPDAIRAKAEEAGFLAAQKQQPPADEVTAQRRIANASSGATETPDPNLAELIGQAQTQEEVMKLITQAGLPTTWNRE